MSYILLNFSILNKFPQRASTKSYIIIDTISIVYEIEMKLKPINDSAINDF